MLVEFPSQTPIRELSVREIEAKKVAVEVFDEITERAMPTSLWSACVTTVIFKWHLCQIEEFVKGMKKEGDRPA